MFEIEHFEINAQLDSYTLGIVVVLFPRTGHTRKICAPVLHVDSHNPEALIFKEGSRYRTIHPTTHTYVNGFRHE
jgi:hypothetical protein